MYSIPNSSKAPCNFNVPEWECSSLKKKVRLTKRLQFCLVSHPGECVFLLDVPIIFLSCGSLHVQRFLRSVWSGASARALLFGDCLGSNGR